MSDHVDANAPDVLYHNVPEVCTYGKFAPLNRGDYTDGENERLATNLVALVKTTSSRTANPTTLFSPLSVIYSFLLSTLLPIEYI